MILNITFLSCCPIVFSNSESRQVSDDFVQSNENSAVTASLVYAENQVNKMQRVDGQVSQNLLNQGRADAEVSRFVNRVELEPLKISMDERSNSLIAQGDYEGNMEVARGESPPPPPPPREQTQSLAPQPEPSSQSPSPSPPPPPPPRHQQERLNSPSPLPEINPKILSPGFMNQEPFDPKTGGRLNTIEVQRPPLDSVKVTRRDQASQPFNRPGKDALWV